MKMSCLSLAGLSAMLIICPVLPQSHAQGDLNNMLSATSAGPSTSNYYFAKSGELTIVVDVLGFVQRPGRYEISTTINLINLLSLAGGATPDGALDDVRITRVLEVGGAIRMREIKVDLEDLKKVNPADLILSPGDVIRVTKTGWSSFRDTFSVVVSAAIITGAVAQVIYATKR